MGKRIRTILCACIAVLSLYSATLLAQEKRQNRDVASAETKLCGIGHLNYKVKLSDEDPPEKLLEVNTTWYGAFHQGKKMSNGERFDACNPTIVASKIYPEKTRLRLHYGGAIADVTVTDTPDKDTGADIDVSFAVALHLGIVVRGRVRDLQVEVLN